MCVGGRGAVVDVHHVRRLDERVVEVFVSRILRMVDLERAAALREIAPNGDVAGQYALSSRHQRICARADRTVPIKSVATARERGTDDSITARVGSADTPVLADKLTRPVTGAHEVTDRLGPTGARRTND